MTSILKEFDKKFQRWSLFNFDKLRQEICMILKVVSIVAKRLKPKYQKLENKFLRLWKLQEKHQRVYLFVANLPPSCAFMCLLSFLSFFLYLQLNKYWFTRFSNGWKLQIVPISVNHCQTKLVKIDKIILEDDVLIINYSKSASNTFCLDDYIQFTFSADTYSIDIHSYTLKTLNNTVWAKR